MVLDFGTVSACGMAELVRRREVSSNELVAAHLRQIERVQGRVNAAVAVLAEEAVASAREADARMMRGEPLGPLHGVPFSVKDSIDVRGWRTTAGTVGLRDAPAASADATVVARLRAAGGIPIAKTNLPDLLFAYESDNLIFGRSNNPYDPERTPGGSSGGEAALIAAGGSALGLGSDAAGSVRVPAAFCGIASIKPTSGRLPRTGHVPAAGGWIEALWQIGPMARQVEDLQLAMEVLAGEDGFDFTCPPAALQGDSTVRGLRVATFTDNGFARCSPGVIAVVQRAAAVLSEAGMQVEEETPPGVAEAYELEMALLGADGGDGIDEYLRAIGSEQQHPLLHAGFVDRMRTFRCPTTGLAALWGRWDQYRREMANFFRRFDAVLCPVYSEPALRHGESAMPGKFEGFSYSMAWNVAGNPAAVVRCGELDGLPVNVQVVTPRWREKRALAICREMEKRLGGFRAPALAGEGPF